MEEGKIQEDLVERLKENVIFQAQHYLKEFGEFYPFAAVIESNGELKPTSVYFGEENPVSIDVISNLEKALQKGIKDNGYKAVAICVDVMTIPPYGKQKMDAIEIRIDQEKSDNLNFYIPYEKLESGEYKFYDIFTNKGTLSLYTKSV